MELCLGHKEGVMNKRIVFKATSITAFLSAFIAGPSFSADLNFGDHGRYGLEVEEVREIPVVGGIDDLDVAGIGVELGDRGNVGVDIDNRLLDNLPIVDGLRLEGIFGR
jgi:hypothetical protein